MDRIHEGKSKVCGDHRGGTGKYLLARRDWSQMFPLFTGEAPLERLVAVATPQYRPTEPSPGFPSRSKGTKMPTERGIMCPGGRYQGGEKSFNATVTGGLKEKNRLQKGSQTAVIQIIQGKKKGHRAQKKDIQQAGKK